MHVDVRNAEGVIIVDFAGRLVAGIGDEVLHDVINELLAAEWKQILLNLSAVSRIDSAGIGELVTSIRLAERFETTVKLLLPGGRVRDVLELSQILPLLDVFEDEQEAIESFRSDRPLD